MMMVDTINPNTSEPDEFSSATGIQPDSAPADQATASDHFYGGFDKPDDVKINLASQNTGESVPTNPVVEAPEVFQNTNAESPQATEQTPNNNPFADLTPATPSPVETQAHSSYTKNAPLNVRGLLVIVGIGLVALVIISTITFFVVSSSNSSKLAKQQAVLDELNAKLAGLTEAPSPLTAAESDTPATSAPVETPAATKPEPVATPAITTPATTVPAASGEDRSGSLG